LALFFTFFPVAPIAPLSRGAPNAGLDCPTAGNDPRIRHIETPSHIWRARHDGEIAHSRRIRYSRQYERDHPAATVRTQADWPSRIQIVKEPEATLLQDKYAPGSADLALSETKGQAKLSSRR
jgi:hypothetical protein